jgi:hypothetical protein
MLRGPIPFVRDKDDSKEKLSLGLVRAALAGHP